MPFCARCGKGIGQYSFESFDSATGCCGDCLQEVRTGIESFRAHFTRLAKSDRLTKEDWSALETQARRCNLSLPQALGTVRPEMQSLVKRVLTERRTNTESSTAAISTVDDVIQTLSIPDTYTDRIREIVAEIKAKEKTAVAIANERVGILCFSCGRVVMGPPKAADYSCGACDFTAVVRRCPSCHITVHIQKEHWYRRVRCLTCRQANSWEDWNAVGIRLEDLARLYKLDKGPANDPARRAVYGTVIGGSGYQIGVRFGCVLDFAQENVIISMVIQGNQYQPIATAKYSGILSLQVGGRGTIKSGGGWVGFGFGVTGMVTGVLLASALNQITTHTNIENDYPFSHS